MTSTNRKPSSAPRRRPVPLTARPAGPKTQEELAYDSLKALILTGELPKGKFLSQRMLALRAGTNITTVRTALRQLESDGLLENVPHWGVRIPAETEARLRDLYFMRELLEVGAVRRFVQNRDAIDTSEIIRLGNLCDALARKLPDSIVEFSQAHFDFHMELATQSGSDLLLQSLNRIHFQHWLHAHDHRLWLRGKTGAVEKPGHSAMVAPREYSLVNHKKMVDALLTADEETAAAEMRKHIYAGLQRELGELDSGSAEPMAKRPRVAHRA